MSGWANDWKGGFEALARAARMAAAERDLPSLLDELERIVGANSQGILILSVLDRDLLFCKIEFRQELIYLFAKRGSVVGKALFKKEPGCFERVDQV